jgi:hypothetical protein
MPQPVTHPLSVVTIAHTFTSPLALNLSGAQCPVLVQTSPRSVVYGGIPALLCDIHRAALHLRLNLGP